MKKKFYAVSTIIKDCDIICNLIGSIYAEEKPANSFKSKNRADYYIDWFDSKEEAEKFVKNPL